MKKQKFAIKKIESEENDNQDSGDIFQEEENEEGDQAFFNTNPFGFFNRSKSQPPLQTDQENSQPSQQENENKRQSNSKGANNLKLESKSYLEMAKSKHEKIEEYQNREQLLGIEDLKNKLEENELAIKDNNGRTIFHRLALEQKFKDLQNIINLELADNKSATVQQLINQTDKYGNSPLSLACIKEKMGKSNDRLEIVKLLKQQKKADPNVINKSSHWTILHWASRHGSLEVIKVLLNKDEKQNEKAALEYIPDVQGLYPIDYAGFFGHYSCVKVLAEQALLTVKEKLELLVKFPSYFDQYGHYVGESINYDDFIKHPLFAFSPHYHTAILYWCCKADKDVISNEFIKTLLSQLSAYPEGPVAMDSYKTALHAAAQEGKYKKLETLISELKYRYNLQGNCRYIPKQELIPGFEQKFQVLLNMSKFSKIKNFYNRVFKKRLQQYQLQKSSMKFNFLDSHANTPLHLASQFGQAKCVEMFLNDGNFTLDLRNQEGLLPTELIMHEDVATAYMSHFKSFEGKYENLSRSANFSDLESFIHEKQKLKNDKYMKQATELDKLSEVKKEILSCREWLPQIPLIIIEANSKKPNQINRMIKILKNTNFQLQIFQGIDNRSCFICCELKQDALEDEAKLMKYKLKLVEVDSKMAYEPNQRVRFEPFRSKDIQIIIMSIIERLIDIQQFKDQQVIFQIFPMHDYQSLNDLFTKWIKNKRNSYMPLTGLGQFLKEGMNVNYPQLNSLKNYFGEKHAFHYAWINFYTTWLAIPGFICIPLTLYQLAYGLDTAIAGVYAAFVSLWITIMMEKWKRKSSEIASQWGVFREGNQERVMRPLFYGDERFSEINYEVDKRDIYPKTYIITVLSIPITLIMIAINLVCYVFTQRIKEGYVSESTSYIRSEIISTTAGFVYGMIISVLNFFYQRIAVYLVQQENHKYKDSYELSFIYKLFTFKFVNSYISAFYTAFYLQDFSTLYTLVLGMVIQKAVQIWIFKGPFKYLMFWRKKSQYFKTLLMKSQLQTTAQEKYLDQLSSQKKQEIEKQKSTLIEKPLYKEFQNEIVYQRLILNPNFKTEQSHLFVDAVEINSRMNFIFERNFINEISDVFILFGFASLFAAVCPFNCLIIFFHNIVDQKIDLYMQCNFIQRPLAEVKSGIGIWLDIAEFISIFTVVINAGLVYVTSTDFQVTIIEKYNISQTNAFWIIIALEHGIIVIKYLMQALIKDRPSWVDKAVKKVQKYEDIIEKEETERDEKNQIALMEKDINEYVKKQKQMQNQIQQYQSQLNQMTQQVQTNKVQEKQKQLTHDKIKLEMQQSVRDNIRLVDFCALQKFEWNGEERMNELDIALNNKFQQRLLKSAFIKIERDIMQRKIIKLYQLRQQTTIICAECTQKNAIIYCQDCQDHFCSVCIGKIHDNLSFSQHKRELIPQKPKQQLQIILGSSQKTDQNLNQTLQEEPTYKEPKWKKFEYYNFPTNRILKQFNILQQQFMYLKYNYILVNYIIGKYQLDYQSLFIDQDYALLHEIGQQMLKEKHKKWFQNNKVQDQSSSFNDEELFYMNRVAFYLFKQRRNDATYDDFVQKLNDLQEGLFDQRLKLWLTLMCEYNITKKVQELRKGEFIMIISHVFVQDVHFNQTVQNIIDQLYGTKNDEDTLSLEELTNVITKIQEIKEFFGCIVQVQFQK